MAESLPIRQEHRATWRRWVFAASVVVAAGMVLAVVYSRLGHDWLVGPPVLRAGAKELRSTLISPHLEASIQPGKNVLWCSTFQLVWNEACRAAGGDLHLKDEPPMVPILDKKTAQESDVDADSCLVMSGRVEDGIVGKIRQELNRKFAGQADPDLLNRIEPTLPQPGYLAYAYLFRSLPFKYPFKRLTEPLRFGSGEVLSFGLRNIAGRMDELHKAEQVVVLDYKNGDDFVVELTPEDKAERIILAKIAPAETLQKTIETVHARIASTGLKEWLKMLGPGESIVVPILNFDLWREYDELYGKSITTPGPLQGWPIVLAMQDIRFRLDERGAILKSEAAFAAKCAPAQKPRQLIFDKPFLILLERRDAAMPYFALWVDNPELLAPFE